MDNRQQEEISLRRLVMDDAEKVFQMSREESLARFLPDQVYQDYEEASRVLEYLIGAYDERIDIENRPYVLGILLNRNNELIGHVGLSKVDEGVEIGYAVEKRYQGCGFARQAVSKMLQILETTTNITEIYGIVEPENISSIKTLEKCGFIRSGSRVNKLVYKKELDHSTTASA